MKIGGLIVIIIIVGSGALQHGCGSAHVTNPGSANNSNRILPSVTQTSSQPDATLQNPGATDHELSFEEAKPMMDLMERCKHTPVSHKVRATPLSGPAPLKVTFDGSSAYDPDGSKIVKWQWHFGNGQSAEGRKTTYTYDKPGKYGIGLDVTDSQGQKTSDCSDVGTGIIITVTNSEAVEE